MSLIGRSRCQLRMASHLVGAAWVRRGPSSLRASSCTAYHLAASHRHGSEEGRRGSSIRSNSSFSAGAALFSRSLPPSSLSPSIPSLPSSSSSSSSLSTLSTALPNAFTSPSRLFSSSSSPLSSSSPPTSSSSGASTTPTPTPTPAGRKGFLAELLDEKHVEASPSFTNRWLIAIPAFATHMCIGSPWGWSVVSGPLTRELGFVSSAAADWSFSETTVPLSITFALQGIAAALGGKWQMKVGARKAMAVAGLCFGGGLMLGGLGVALHSLPLLYLGYGLLGGTGVGLGYTPPVQALIQWFPDRRGLASGMTIAGFGSGALVFTPVANKLMQMFSTPPTYLGPTASVPTVVHDGKMFADVAGQLTEVVSANAYEISKLATALPEGIYVVGSGSTGVWQALVAMGTAYLGIMMASAFAIRRPAAGYVPAGYTPPQAATDPAASGKAGDGAPVALNATNGHVPLETVMKTPQFYLLGTTFFCLACGGMGIFSVAKPMMGEVFGGTLPAIVTASFASSYVMMLSAGNLGGRLGWALFFDKFGPKTTFNIFTLGSIPLYLSVPFCVSWMVDSPSVTALSVFIASTLTAISFMGGTYALLPAYEASLFGSKNVGAVHGRMLMASAFASLAGPATLLWLRGISEQRSIKELAAKVSDEQFQKAFGAPVSELQELIAAKTVTISKLLEALPPGTPDPTPFIYDSTMYALAGLASVALVAQAMVRPVKPQLFVKN